MKYWRKRLTNKAAPNDIMLGQISHELGGILVCHILCQFNLNFGQLLFQVNLQQV